MLKNNIEVDVKIKCIEAGKEKGIELPKQEKINFTNFIR